MVGKLGNTTIISSFINMTDKGKLKVHSETHTFDNLVEVDDKVTELFPPSSNLTDSTMCHGCSSLLCHDHILL